MNRSISIAAVLAILALAYWAFYSKDMHSNLENTNPRAVASEGQGQVQQLPPASFAGWHEYVAPSGQFSVLMPTLPHTAMDNIADPKTSEMRTYQIFVSAKEDGSVFSVYLISFSDKMRKSYDQVFLENFMKEMLTSNPHTQVKDIQLVDFNKNKAVDFDLETQEAKILGKAFLVGQTLYILSETAKPDKMNPKDFDFFVNSFSLNPKAKSSDTSKNK